MNGNNRGMVLIKDSQQHCAGCGSFLPSGSIRYSGGIIVHDLGGCEDYVTQQMKRLGHGKPAFADGILKYQL
jgi:hypothetical protein